MQVRIYETDTIEEMGEKIYKHFEPLQSCSVIGWVQNLRDKTLDEKGKLVFDEICRLDKLENFEPHTGGKIKRKRRMFTNSNGASEMHKIFRWKRKLDSENNLRYTIWRMQ